jgi:hypothetical protein
VKWQQLQLLHLKPAGCAAGFKWAASSSQLQITVTGNLDIANVAQSYQFKGPQKPTAEFGRLGNYPVAVHV